MDYKQKIFNKILLRILTHDSIRVSRPYPVDYVSQIKTGINKKVLGMLKDGAGGNQFEEFVGLGAKFYSY